MADKKEISGDLAGKEPLKEKITKEEVKPKKKPAVVKEVKAVVEASAKPVEKPEPRVAFSYWFRSKRFKPHWAAGMQAFADTTRRRTVAEWDRLFKDY